MFLRHLVGRPRWATYPEINLEVPAPSKFPVADLERNSHLIILVQCLVEAFS